MEFKSGKLNPLLEGRIAIFPFLFLVFGGFFSNVTFLNCWMKYAAVVEQILQNPNYKKQTEQVAGKPLE